MIIALFTSSCSNNDDTHTNNATNLQSITEEEKAGLLFMLEEEKLARDTYEFLDSEWGIIQFTNIKIIAK